MKIYKPKCWFKIVFTTFILLIFVIGGILFLVYNKEATLFQKIIIFIGIIFGLGGVYTFNNIRITIDNQKIEVFTIDSLSIFKGKGIKRVTTFLNWDEIGELDSRYILYPEGPIVILKPKIGLNKRNIEFGMDGISLELIKDILSHLSPDTKVYLYPYLKRKLEGKQTWFYIK